MEELGSTYENQGLLFEIIDQGKIRVFEYFILSLNLLSHYTQFFL